jgi:hypothetical protein
MGGRSIDANWFEVADELDRMAAFNDIAGGLVPDEVLEAARYRAAFALRREAKRLREDVK